MRRLHLLAVSGLTVFAVVAAAPAAASLSVTRSQVRHSLLTAAQLGDGWHRFDDTGDSTSTIEGCGGAATSAPFGLRFQPTLAFQYGQAASFVHEQIYTFRTVKGAKADFAANVTEFNDCDSFTLDGKTWQVIKLTMPSYADQRAIYRLSGPVATAAGVDVPVTMFLIVTRYGHHEVLTMATVGGQLTSTVRTEIKKSAVLIAKMATLKVEDRLGR